MDNIPQRAFAASIIPDHQPIVQVEFRGHKVTEIKWTDKSTKAQNSMLKYTVACEFGDGTQVSLVQMGKDFAGQFPFVRGEKYAFALRSFSTDRDNLSGDFLAVGPVSVLTSSAKAPGLPSLPPR